MCAAADFLFETARYEDPTTGPVILNFYLPIKTPGINVQNNWDTMSIRASASHDIVWENVFVPEEIATRRPVGLWDQSMNMFCRWNPSLEACYLGLAQAARDWAVTWTGQRRQEPFEQPMSHLMQRRYPRIGAKVFLNLAAEMEVGLRAARALLIQTATAIAETPWRPAVYSRTRFGSVCGSCRP